MIDNASESIPHGPEPATDFQSRNPKLHRMLKIEPAGDLWKGGLRPKIRLMGRWLERAGFKPDTHVRVTCVALGIIELRSELALNNSAIGPSSHLSI